MVFYSHIYKMLHNLISKYDCYFLRTLSCGIESGGLRLFWISRSVKGVLTVQKLLKSAYRKNVEFQLVIESAGVNQLYFRIVCLFLLISFHLLSEKKNFCYQSYRADSALQNCTFSFSKYCSETDLRWFSKLPSENN